ncbi:hypothetical protein C5S31_08460 [ANME-1 cluster archaeon GoMg2]|nr:hypothetical protein [ANME-1 cluster archaeon GoMg2]
MEKNDWIVPISYFLIGAFLWTIALGFILLLGDIVDGMGSIFLWILFTPLIVVSGLSIKGWDWYSEYELGTLGFFIKFLVWMFMAFTVIGIIPICYWTGKSVARWFYL